VTAQGWTDSEYLLHLVEKLRRTHLVVEDCWYSCPKSGECCNDVSGDQCDCGADQHNARVDSLIAYLFPTGT
jgi:hypothetical protein